MRIGLCSRLLSIVLLASSTTSTDVTSANGYPAVDMTRHGGLRRMNVGTGHDGHPDKTAEKRRALRPRSKRSGKYNTARLRRMTRRVKILQDEMTTVMARMAVVEQAVFPTTTTTPTTTTPNPNEVVTPFALLLTDALEDIVLITRDLEPADSTYQNDAGVSIDIDAGCSTQAVTDDPDRTLLLCDLRDERRKLALTMSNSQCGTVEEWAGSFLSQVLAAAMRDTVMEVEDKYNAELGDDAAAADVTCYVTVGNLSFDLTERVAAAGEDASSTSCTGTGEAQLSEISVEFDDKVSCISLLPGVAKSVGPTSGQGDDLLSASALENKDNLILDGIKSQNLQDAIDSFQTKLDTVIEVIETRDLAPAESTYENDDGVSIGIDAGCSKEAVTDDSERTLLLCDLRDERTKLVLPISSSRCSTAEEWADFFLSLALAPTLNQIVSDSEAKYNAELGDDAAAADVTCYITVGNLSFDLVELAAAAAQDASSTSCTGTGEAQLSEMSVEFDVEVSCISLLPGIAKSVGPTSGLGDDLLSASALENKDSLIFILDGIKSQNLQGATDSFKAELGGSAS